MKNISNRQKPGWLNLRKSKQTIIEGNKLNQNASWPKKQKLRGKNSQKAA